MEDICDEDRELVYKQTNDLNQLSASMALKLDTWEFHQFQGNFKNFPTIAQFESQKLQLAQTVHSLRQEMQSLHAELQQSL